MGRRALIFVLSSVIALGGCGNDTPQGPAVPVGAKAGEGCASPAGNVPAGVIDPQVIWPPVPYCSSDPRELARSFARKYIGLEHPRVSEFKGKQLAGGAHGDIDIFRGGESTTIVEHGRAASARRRALLLHHVGAVARGRPDCPAAARHHQLAGDRARTWAGLRREPRRRNPSGIHDCGSLGPSGDRGFDGGARAVQHQPDVRCPRRCEDRGDRRQERLGDRRRGWLHSPAGPVLRSRQTHGPRGSALALSPGRSGPAGPTRAAPFASSRQRRRASFLRSARTSCLCTGCNGSRPSGTSAGRPEQASDAERGDARLPRERRSVLPIARDARRGARVHGRQLRARRRVPSWRGDRTLPGVESGPSNLSAVHPLVARSRALVGTARAWVQVSTKAGDLGGGHDVCGSTRCPADACRRHVSTTRVMSRRVAGASCFLERSVR